MRFIYRIPFCQLKTARVWMLAVRCTAEANLNK